MMSYLHLSQNDESVNPSQQDTTTTKVDQEKPPLLDKSMEQKLLSVINLQGSENVVRLKVGNKLFMTTRQTIERTDNIIKVMLNSDIPLDRDEDGSILFVDQNPLVFHYILEYMEFSGDLHKVIIDRDLDSSLLESLCEDASFFGCTPLVNKVQFILNTKNSKSDVVSTSTSEVPVQSHDQTDDIAQQDLINNFESLLNLRKDAGQQYFSSKNESLQEKSKDFLARKDSIVGSDKTLELKLNVRGRSFVIPFSVISRFPESIFFHLFSACGNKEIFLDKDPDIFALLLQYMSTLKYDHFPKGYYLLRRVKRDARFYNLRELCSTFFNKYRYPIETLGQKNMKMKAQEDVLRGLFATDRDNPLLNDPYIHLLPIFHLPASDLQPDEDTQSIPMLFNFEDVQSVKKYATVHWNDTPIPKLVDSMDTFLQQWNIMTCSLLEGMDWSNVFAAGGGVLASAIKVPETKQSQYRNDNNEYSDVTDSSSDDDDDEAKDLPNTRVYYENKPCNKASFMPFSRIEPQESYLFEGSYRDLLFTLKRLYPTSDIDLFLYGLSEKEAEDKIEYIYQTIKKNMKSGMYQQAMNILRGESREDILIVRTKSAITFRSQFFRSFQIILRIYKSPAEVLIGFDIDSCCIGFDGTTVWTLPRARRAIVNRMNLVDVDRQSTTFELRLYKYAKRGFRVGVPGYHHEKVKNNDVKYLTWHSNKPNLYNTHFGLARLLLLESSLAYKKQSFRTIGLPSDLSRVPQTIQRPSFLRVENEFELDLSESDYSSVAPMSSHDAATLYRQLVLRYKKVKELKQQKLDNPLWNPSVVLSLNNMAKILHNTDNDSDLSPKIQWITVEPGRQYIGSFNPTDRNFFRDAYSTSKLQLHQKIERFENPNVRKLYTVTWSLRKGKKPQYFNEEETERIEKAYCQYQESPRHQRLQKEHFNCSEGSINFMYMTYRGTGDYMYHSYPVQREKRYVGIEYRDAKITGEEESGGHTAISEYSPLLPGSHINNQMSSHPHQLQAQQQQQQQLDIRYQPQTHLPTLQHHHFGNSVQQSMVPQQPWHPTTSQQQTNFSSQLSTPQPSYQMMQTTPTIMPGSSIQQPMHHGQQIFSSSSTMTSQHPLLQPGAHPMYHLQNPFASQFLNNNNNNNNNSNYYSNNNSNNNSNKNNNNFEFQ